MIIGGLRIGDTFHFIPLLDSLANDEVTWVCGTYEYVAVELLAKHFPQIKQVISVKHRRVPFHFEDRIEFIGEAAKFVDRSKYDRVIDDPTLSLEWGDAKNKVHKIKKGSYFKVEPREDYIAVHTKSISDWKNLDLLTNGTTYPLPTRSLDGVTSMDLAFDIINKSRFVVGIHSAMACLSLYCNKPLICAAYDDMALKFSSIRPYNIDLVVPSPRELEEAVLEMMQKTESLTEDFN